MLKRISVLFLAIGFIFTMFAINGCGGTVTRISLVGSTSVQPIAELLVEKYSKENPNTNINVQGGGSSAGIKAALDGTAEIGTSSRELSPTEQQGLTTVTIALDGIAIVIQPQNKINSLTIDQVRKIFAGEITDWSQIGGIKRPIVVVNREEGSGTRGAFTELVMGKTPLALKSIVQGSTGAVRQTVAGNPDAIGYISLASVDPSVKSLSINGVTCTVANIKQKTYPIVRPFLFITKGKASVESQKFIDFILSKEGQTIIVNNGLVAVK